MAFDLGLENKVVVITGGATGIGFATGLEFARQGAHVAICGRSEAKLAKAREAFAAEGFSSSPRRWMCATPRSCTPLATTSSKSSAAWMCG